MDRMLVATDRAVRLEEPRNAIRAPPPGSQPPARPSCWNAVSPLDDYTRKRRFDRTPEPTPRRRRARAATFVVHRHEARSLHYDLRLSMDGVLKCWAVPRGFSYDPKEKRLAVQTEDHPLEYETFEGVIPKGEYGAGTMRIWDRGTYEVVKADDGAAAIAGGELKVKLAGRRLRGEWHLVKTRQGPTHWLLFKSKDRYAGPDRDSALGIELGAAPASKLPRSVRPMVAGEQRAAFTDPRWVFEMQFAGRRTLAAKAGERIALRGVKAKLPAIEAELAKLRAEDALLDGVLVALDEHERPCAQRLAARLAGDSDAPVVYYAFDLLHWDGFDLRPLPLIERKAALRAILPASEAVLYVDHVAGNGQSLLEAVAAAGLPGAIGKRADSAYASGPSADWCAIEAAASQPAQPLESALRARRRPAARRSRVQLSNLDKVFWPAEGYTKGDLLAYYESVADVLLPYLHDRPCHLNRFPDGIDGKSFYQREAKEHTPAWVATVPIDSDTHGGAVPHVLCNDRDTLLYIVNLGSIDLHPWLSRRGSLDSPDWAVLDLDPKSAPFAQVVRIAREVGKLLRGIGLRPLLKTSGKTGLHVYVPLEPGYTYAQSAMFCEAVARCMVRDLPDIATVERDIGARGARVYVDFLQNRRAQTVVPPYSVRPVRGAQVSTPLAWDELDGELSPGAFTILTVPERLEQRGDLFRPALTDRQDLRPAIAKLEALLRG
jgi:bifunctional non-homologous end joining protein LigD